MKCPICNTEMWEGNPKVENIWWYGCAKCGKVYELKECKPIFFDNAKTVKIAKVQLETLENYKRR